MSAESQVYFGEAACGLLVRQAAVVVAEGFCGAALTTLILRFVDLIQFQSLRFIGTALGSTCMESCIEESCGSVLK